MHDLLRILIISDLHFKIEDQNNKDSALSEQLNSFTNNIYPVKIIGDEYKKKIINLIKKACGQKKPDAIVIAGDLVEYGGAKDGEFEKCINFILELQRELDFKDDDKICIVPGNHDVNWNRNTRKDKFYEFNSKLNRYKIPRLSGNFFSTEDAIIESKNTDFKVRLKLIASPTFSGVIDSNITGFNKFSDIISKVIHSKSESQKIIEIFKDIDDGENAYDIAAIGDHQLQQIANIEQDENIVDIAILHHNLLPDSSISINPFASVIDAGKVLDVLIDKKYFLVINGHQHNRRFVSYEQNSKNIELFTCPSLFHDNGDSLSGFTLLDINKRNDVFKGRLTTYFNADNGNHHKEYINEISHNKSCASTEIKSIIQDISLISQNTQIVKLLTNIAESLSWKKELERSDEKSKLSQFFDDSYRFWECIIENMSEKKIYINSPLGNNNKWENFIFTINSMKPKALYVTSKDDIHYWEKAISSPEGSPASYSKILSKFQGTITNDKQRLLILSSIIYPEDQISIYNEECLEEFTTTNNFKREKIHTNRDTVEKVHRVVAYMNSLGFSVGLVYSDNLPGEKNHNEYDFSILGDLCVSHWDALGGDDRTLIEHLDENYIYAKKALWNYLVERIKLHFNSLRKIEKAE